MSVEAETYFNPNVNKHTIALVRILVCAGKGTVFTCGFKHEIERVKILEFRKYGTKNLICMENRTYVGTSFVRTRGQNEVCA